MDTPLSLPADLQKAGAIGAAFVDFPFFGLRSRQLAQRSGSISDSEWLSPANAQTARVIAKIIQNHLRWSSAHFLPDDPCELLLRSARDGMEVVEVLMDISEHFHIPDVEKIFSPPHTATFRDTVTAVADCSASHAT